MSDLFDEADVAIAMEQKIWEDEAQEAQELLSAINRVAAGMGGEAEAKVLASALGLEGFNNRRGGEDE